MGAPLTTGDVWHELATRSFAVVSYTTGTGEPRSAGIVYVVESGRLLFATGPTSWKVRALRANPRAAVTVTIDKRIPFLPWIQIPAATISFHGTATVSDLDEVDAATAHRLLHGLEDDARHRADTCIVAIAPTGSFVTYGVGVRMMAMRDRDKARGRVPVS